MSRFLLVAVFLTTCQTLRADEIRHRFLAVDESRHRLLHVDQVDPANDWAIALEGKHRDIQLVGGQAVMLTFADGYREFSLTSRKLLKEVKGYPGATSARRLADGQTVLACNAQGVTVYELDSGDKPLRKVNFSVPTTRLLRLTPQGTLLFGSSNVIFEGDWQGKIVKTLTLPKGTWFYQAIRLPSGNLLAAAGYDPAMMEIDTEGKIVKSIGGRDTAEAKTLGYHFFGAFQVLAGGNIVVSNWTGHGPEDSRKGVQLVEYDPAGRMVWKWHDPQRAGSINGVIVLDGLDGLDTAILNDDTVPR
ncbi:MAG: hypothetical protein HUU20_03220 [Pirellulales bacterium]|nr:hypothetical protein [Pirellulales bacterium]